MDIGPKTTLGWMATWDSMRFTHDLGSVEGEGWLLGPYLVMGLADLPLQVEGRALFGRTHDFVTQTGSSAQSVWGNRNLVMLKVKGTMDFQRLTLSPNLSFSQVQQRSESYVTTSDVNVGSVFSQQRQGALGVDFTFDSANRIGNLQYFGGINAVLREDSQSGSSKALRYNLGFVQQINPLSDFRVEATGERDLNSNASSLGLSMKLDLKF